MINVSRSGNTKNFSKTQFMVQRTESIRKYMVLFSPDLKYKVHASIYIL